MGAALHTGSRLLASDQSTNHGPTLDLLTALRENHWGAKWWSPEGGNAMLVHPKYGHLEVEIDPQNTDRLLTFADGREVSHRFAMERARGER